MHFPGHSLDHTSRLSSIISYNTRPRTVPASHFVLRILIVCTNLTQHHWLKGIHDIHTVLFFLYFPLRLCLCYPFYHWGWHCHPRTRRHFVCPVLNYYYNLSTNSTSLSFCASIYMWIKNYLQQMQNFLCQL